MQVLHRIVKHWIILSSLLRGWNEVCTGKDLGVTWKLVKSDPVKSIDIFIFTGEDDALREVLIRKIGGLNVGIDGINERGNSVFSTPEVVRKSDVAQLICVLAMAHLQLPPCKVGLCFNVVLRHMF